MESVLEDAMGTVMQADCYTGHQAYLFMPLLLRRRANIRMMVNNQSAAIPSADAQVMNHWRRCQRNDCYTKHWSLTALGSPRDPSDAFTKLTFIVSVLCFLLQERQHIPIDCRSWGCKSIRMIRTQILMSNLSKTLCRVHLLWYKDMHSCHSRNATTRSTSWGCSWA